MTVLFVPNNWLSHFVMRYLAFSGWMMTLLKRQDEYLNQRVILFRLQYETRSLQMHPELPCRSVVAPMPKLSEQRYALRLVVVPCWYLPSSVPFFQPIFFHLRCPTSLLLPSRIYFASVSIPVFPHLRHRACPPLSLLMTLYAIPIIPHLHRASIVILLCLCCGSHRIIFHIPVYFVSVFCLPSCIGSYLHSALFCNTLLAPLCSTLIFSLSAMIFSLHFSFLFWHGSSISPWCSCSAPICTFFFSLAFTPLCSNLVIPLRSVCSHLHAPYIICSTLIAPFMLWSACSDMLWSDCSDMLCLSFLWNF